MTKILADFIRIDEKTNPIKNQIEDSGIVYKGSHRFHQILKELGDLHDKKQADYGRPADPFANVRASSDFGIKPWVGAMVRANDKMRRIQKFASEGNLANESVEDSFRDLAVYAIIALVLYEESHNA